MPSCRFARFYPCPCPMFPHKIPLLAASAASGRPESPSPREAETVETLAQPRLLPAKPPAMYQVLLINDDFTPMEFVVLILQEFFNKDHQTATTIMYKVHTEGRGVCGIYTREVAQTKASQVMNAARSAGHPLQCVYEPVPEA